jgi:Uma2 family endonuclease
MAATVSPSLPLAERLRRLGNVPRERIVTDPAPGTATVADVQRLCDGAARRRRGLVDGVLVELLGPTNTRGEMQRKRKDSFSAGVELVWSVDPEERTMEVFTGVDQKQTLREGDAPTGGTVLPGFEVPVRQVFAAGELRRPGSDG